MSDRPHVPGPADDLALTALRFAAGELSADRAEEFAERMAHDQSARDALADAIRLSAAALGQPAPSPDPLVREAVREDLRPTLVNRLFRRRPYRGHPFVWAGLGGAVAAGLTGVGVWLGDSAMPVGRPAPSPAPVVVAPTAVPAVPVAVVRSVPEELPPVVAPTVVAVEVAPPPTPVEEPAVATASADAAEPRGEKPVGKGADARAVEGSEGR